MKKPTSFTFIAIIAVSLSLSASTMAAWTPAPSSPPNGNVEAPVNIGNSYQNKSGLLRAGQLLSSGWNYINSKVGFFNNFGGGDNRPALIFGAKNGTESWYLGQLQQDDNVAIKDQAITLWSWAGSWIQTWLPNGNVGIGTVAPTAKLEVDGQVMIKDGSQGAGKVLMSDDKGLASWQNVTPTQSVSGTSSHGKQRFLSNGIFKVPAGVTTVWVLMSGGGGAGGSSTNGSTNGYGGGGADAVIAKEVQVLSLENIPITVGIGGKAVSYGESDDGGTSSFGSYISTPGGENGTRYPGKAGGPGGSGARANGDGGDSIFGSGGSYYNAGGYGGGGQGGGPGTSGGMGHLGGPGTQGFVLVEW